MLHADFAQLIHVAEQFVRCKHTASLARFQVWEALKSLGAVTAQRRRSLTIVPARPTKSATRKSEPNPYAEI